VRLESPEFRPLPFGPEKDDIRSETPRASLGALIVVWFVSVGAVFAGVAVYKGTPGDPAGPAPLVFPDAPPLERAEGERKLLVFLHPRCACSHATLAELERLLVGAPRQGLSVDLIFLLPEGEDEGFADTALHRKASRIPRSRSHLDRGGALAARFGAGTSGHTLFYDEAGALRFSGGITPSRGHEGASQGGQRLATLLHGGLPDGDESAVYGCRLSGGSTEGLDDDDE